MSMMECAHCHRTQDSRSMKSCDGCGAMICGECEKTPGDCTGEEFEYEP